MRIDKPTVRKKTEKKSIKILDAWNWLCNLDASTLLLENPVGIILLQYFATTNINSDDKDHLIGVSIR